MLPLKVSLLSRGWGVLHLLLQSLPKKFNDGLVGQFCIYDDPLGLCGALYPEAAV